MISREMNFHSFITALVIIITVSGLNISCSNLPEKTDDNDILNQARDAYDQAKVNPNTAQLESLAEADKALTQAEKSENIEEKKHFAYLAQKQAQMALVIAERQTYEAEKERLVEQQKKILSEINKLEKYYDAQNQQLQKQLESLTANPTDRLVVTLDEVLFETGQADLQPGAWYKLKMVAEFLNQNPIFQVQIEGHTDNVGSYEYNLGLSERRATSVKFALMERGVSSKRIIVKGFGEIRPIASNRTQAGRLKNRRVELLIFNQLESFE